MNRIQLIALAPALIATFIVPAAKAEPTRVEQDGIQKPLPLQVSLWNPVQTSDENASIHGMRLNLPYGKNRDVHGFDLGIANQLSGNMHGLQLGLGGYAAGDMLGVQSNFVLSMARGNVMGLQQGIYTSAGSLSGVQWGAVNHVENAAYGARFAAVNVSETSTEGAEFGIVNYARRSRGLQLGIVNVTEELHGVQIGLANIAKNGFLPFFPIVNAAM